MNKIVITLLLAFTLVSCSTAGIPNYIPDKNPYEKEFFTDFDTAVIVVKSTLEEFGWQVVKETDPGIYERGRALDTSGDRQTLIFTNIRQSLLSGGIKHVRLNAYLRATPNKSVMIELRYAAITVLPFKKFHDYRDDSLITQIQDAIAKKIK